MAYIIAYARVTVDCRWARAEDSDSVQLFICCGREGVYLLQHVVELGGQLAGVGSQFSRWAPETELIIRLGSKPH